MCYASCHAPFARAVPCPLAHHNLAPRVRDDARSHLLYFSEHTKSKDRGFLLYPLTAFHEFMIAVEIRCDHFLTTENWLAWPQTLLEMTVKHIVEDPAVRALFRVCCNGVALNPQQATRLFVFFVRKHAQYRMSSSVTSDARTILRDETKGTTRARAQRKKVHRP